MIAVPLALPAQDQKRWFFARHQSRITVVAFSILGLVLRITMARRGGIWCDEAQFLWIVRMPTLPEMIDFLRDHESHPPLFYLLMRLWTGIFGHSDMVALA